MKCIIDTNVPCMANSADPTDMTELEVNCAIRCSDFIKKFIDDKSSKLVVDQGREIVGEYEKNISQTGQPGMANLFLDWVYQYLCRMAVEDFIYINKTSENEYEEFPNHKGLKGFDPADRKFVAVAHAHPHHPVIIQGTDSKWWRFKEVLKACGIEIHFIDEEYMKSKI